MNKSMIFRTKPRSFKDTTHFISKDCINGTKLQEYIDKYNVEYVLNDFSASNDIIQSWAPLIDAEMYSKALTEFVKYGDFPYFPTKYIYSWIGILMRNTAILLSDTILYGRGNYFPIKECEEWLSKNYNDFTRNNTWKNCYDKLTKIGLYDWLKLPDKTIGLTDFGIKELFDILKKYNNCTSAEDAFVLVNLSIDVYHIRGDLSSIFIKGGKETLNKFI